MLQEAATQKVINIAVKSEKYGAKELIKAVNLFIKRHKNKVERSGGKTSVKKLLSYGKGISETPVGDSKDLKDFKRFSQKFNIKYCVKKTPDGKYTTFIRSPDINTLESFYRSFMERNFQKSKEPARESVNKKMRNTREKSQELDKDVKSKDIQKTRVKVKERELER